MPGQNRQPNHELPGVCASRKPSSIKTTSRSAGPATCHRSPVGSRSSAAQACLSRILGLWKFSHKTSCKNGCNPISISLLPLRHDIQFEQNLPRADVSFPRVLHNSKRLSSWEFTGIAVLPVVNNPQKPIQKHLSRLRGRRLSCRPKHSAMSSAL